MYHLYLYTALLSLMGWLSIMDACEGKVFRSDITIEEDTLQIPVTYQDDFFRLFVQKGATQLSAVPKTHDFATDFFFQETYKRPANDWDEATGEERTMTEAYLFLNESCNYFQSIEDSLTGLPYLVIKSNGSGSTSSGGSSSNYVINIKLTDASRVIVYHESLHAYLNWRGAGGFSWWTKAINEGLCDVLACMMEADNTGSTDWEITTRNGIAYRKLHQAASLPMGAGGLPHNGGRVIGHWAYLLHTDLGVPMDKIRDILLDMINDALPTETEYDYDEIRNFTVTIAAESAYDIAEEVAQAWDMVGVTE